MFSRLKRECRPLSRKAFMAKNGHMATTSVDNYLYTVFLLREIIMPHCAAHFTSAGIAFIKQWQGLSLEKYQDKNGVWVIGYGHEITPDETFVAPISMAQAESLLLTDLDICQALIRTNKPQLNDPFQQEVFIAWMLSVGITRFCHAERWPVNISQPDSV